MGYRNLNRKYNKVELLQLEEDLKKNLTVTKIATKQKPDVVVADHHTMTELPADDDAQKAPSKNITAAPTNQKVSLDETRKIQTIGERSHEQTLNNPGEEIVTVQSTSITAQKEVHHQVEFSAKLVDAKSKTSHQLKRPKRSK